MVSRIYEESIIDAKKARDAGEYLLCIRILKGLKSFIHETEPLQQAKDKEKQLDDEYGKNMSLVKANAYKMEHQMEEFFYTQTETEKQQDGYAQSYLDFYHKLTVKHDL